MPDMFELPIQGTNVTNWALIKIPANGFSVGGNGILALTG
jgi:levanase/fructan beta-fructosidase